MVVPPPPPPVAPSLERPPARPARTDSTPTRARGRPIPTWSSLHLLTSEGEDLYTSAPGPTCWHWPDGYMCVLAGPRAGRKPFEGVPPSPRRDQGHGRSVEEARAVVQAHAGGRDRPGQAGPGDEALGRGDARPHHRR